MYLIAKKTILRKQTAIYFLYEYTVTAMKKNVSLY